MSVPAAAASVAEEIDGAAQSAPGRRSEEAEARGAPESELRLLRFHGFNWARRTEAGDPRRRPAPDVAEGSGVTRCGSETARSSTGPGEIFSEIGLAVKERSPADVTLYAGYTNGCVSYFPTASEYPLGGYEPSYGNKTYGLPAQVSPACDRLLVEHAASASGSCSQKGQSSPTATGEPREASDPPPRPQSSVPPRPRTRAGSPPAPRRP